MSRVGEVFKTNEGYTIQIVEYFGCNNCTIEFENGRREYNKQYTHVKRGVIKNKEHRGKLGIGYIGIGPHSTSISNRITSCYRCWSGILCRCYDERTRLKYPTYIDTIVCEEWHNFQNFAEWYKDNYIEGYQLDKDILIKGNKIYSPETCCFVPSVINTLFTNRRKLRGELPLGVTKLKSNKSKFEASLRKESKLISLGTFNSPEEAFIAYKVEKESHIKKVADQWKGRIAEKVYQAMYNYKVEITD